jgi:FkbM family methyltransferase
MSLFLAKIGRLSRNLKYFGELPRCFFVFRAPFRVIAGYLGLRSSFPFVCESRSGQRINVSGREDLATVWIINLRNEYTVRKDDQVIIDCGANIGAFTIYAAAQAQLARIFAVEPFPSTFEDLRENVKLNGLEERVRCIQIALTTGDISVNMYAEAPSQARQVIRASGADTVAVPGTDLQSLLGRIDAGVVDLLKMDIEGSEHTVLLQGEPGVLAGIRRISLEYHQNGLKKPLFDHLKSAGFILRRDRILGENYGVAEFDRDALAHKSRKTPS